MKNTLLTFLLFLPFFALAQLKVNTDKSVAVGISYVTDTKLMVSGKADHNRTLYVYTSPFTSNNAAIIGIHNIIQNNASKQKIGIKNELKESPGTTQPSYGQYNKSDMYGTGNGSAGIFNWTRADANSTGTKYGVYTTIDNAGSGARYALYANGGTKAGFFGGNVHINGVLTQSSDRALKQDIQEITSVREKFQQIKARRYKMKEDAKGEWHYGFIAQELEPLFPELVAPFMLPGDPILETEQDEEGNPTEVQVGETPGQTYKSINYIEVIPILVQVIQEQQTQLEALEQRIKELEGE